MRTQARSVKVAGLAIVGVILLTQTAFALEPVGEPGGTRADWSQLWQVWNSAFDHVQIRMAGPATDLFRADADPPLPAPPERAIDLLPGTWAQTYNDQRLVIADGVATSFLPFRLHFDGSQADPRTFYFQLWNGTNFVGESTAAWDGAGWTVTGGSPWADVRIHAVLTLPEWLVTVPIEADLSLLADASCYHVGDTVTVRVNMANAQKTIVSGQYWLGFDPSKLVFLSAVPGDPGDPLNPFTEEVYEVVNQAAGKLDYSSGVPILTSGTMADSTMAIITFEALSEVCETDNLITFRAYDPADPHPPTRLSHNFVGGAVYATLWEMGPMTIDSTAPVHDNCPGGDPAAPPEVTVECDLLDVTWPVYDPITLELLVTATDACDEAPVVTFTEVRTDGPCLYEYDLVRTWTATDNCGNAADCVLIIHVIDTTSPTLRGCPSNKTVECDAVPPAATVTATDNCTDPVSVVFEETRTDGDCPFRYSLLRKWTATDDCGNFACCTQTITVVDTMAPELTGCPEDADATCDAVPTVAVVTATDNCTIPISVAFEEIKTTHSCADAYTLTRIWTAEDECGNVSSCTQIISVSDDEPPVIAGCPADVTVECDAVPTPAVISVTDNCDPGPSVVFTEVRTNGICPDTYTLTRIWTAEDRCGNAAQCVQIITVEDTTPPVITCPPDITVSADVGGCTASLCPGPASATDNCDDAPYITGLRSDQLDLCADPYPTGITTIVWTATDDCGNSEICIQTIEVLPYNDVVVTVCLDGVVFSPLIRCIRFELWNCNDPLQPVTIVDANITFINGEGTAVLQVPCSPDPYTCITVRDTLHTLRRTLDPLPIVGTQYVADFVAAGKCLIGGNLNDDYWIDTLDFGTYIYELANNYGTGDTPCPTAGPHADVDGNGIAWTEDFTFIAINFIQHHEPNCCGQPGKSGGDEGGRPIVKISVKELKARGLGHLAIADLNHDGMLNMDDMTAYMDGATPGSGPTPAATAITRPIGK